MLLTPPGQSVAFCWSSVILSVVQINSLNTGLSVGYEPGTLLVSELNKVKKTRHNLEWFIL